MTPSLPTVRLELRPGPADALRAELAGREALASAPGVDIPGDWPPALYDDDPIRHTLTPIGEHTDGGPFGIHYVLLRSGRQGGQPAGTLMGTVGFKGSPDATGDVEIGCGVVRAAQQRQAKPSLPR